MKIAQFTTNVATPSFMNEVRGRQSYESQPSIKQALVEESYSKDDLILAVNNMNQFLEPVSTNLKFVYHEELNDYYVTIVDPITDEIIREIPPKKMLDMYVAMAEYMGLLVDEKI